MITFKLIGMLYALQNKMDPDYDAIKMMAILNLDATILCIIISLI